MPKKNAAAVELGRKGGKARAKNLTAKQLSKSARDAARARWGEIVYVLGALPRSIGPGRVLVHNNVKPARRACTRGFRAWIQKPDKKRLIICRCNWAGAKLPVTVHYRRGTK
jgi:hypothetical protein